MGGSDGGLIAPADVATTPVSSNRIDVSWTDPNGGETGYLLERSLSSSPSTFLVIATLPSDATTYQDTPLAANTRYYYRLRAFKDKGKNRDHSPYSETATAMTSGVSSTPTPTRTPTAVPTSTPTSTPTRTPTRTPTPAPSTPVPTATPTPPASSDSWAQGFGGSGIDKANDMVRDSSGDMVVVGSFESSIDLGNGTLNSAGSSDVFVAKYAGDGVTLWSRRFGGSGADEGQRVGVDSSGDVFVTGTFEGTTSFGGTSFTSQGGKDVFLAKYSGVDGSHLWSKRLGGSQSEGSAAVVVDGSNRILLATETTADDGFQNDLLVSQYSSSGALVWSKTLNVTMGLVEDIAADSAGNFVVAGGFLGGDFGGGFISTGGSQDGFVVRMSSTGAHLWSRRLGATFQGSVNGVVTSSSGDVFVTGSFKDQANFGGGWHLGAKLQIFAAKLAAQNGAHLWSKSFGDSGTDIGNAITLDPTDGNVVIGGTFQGSVNFGGGAVSTLAGDIFNSDIFLAKLSAANGGHVWSTSLAGNGPALLESLESDTNGDLLIPGSFGGWIEIDAQVLNSNGNWDLFLARSRR